MNGPSVLLHCSGDLAHRVLLLRPHRGGMIAGRLFVTILVVLTFCGHRVYAQDSSVIVSALDSGSNRTRTLLDVDSSSTDAFLLPNDSASSGHFFSGPWSEDDAATILGLAVDADTVQSHKNHMLLGMAIGTVAGAGLGYGLVFAVCDKSGDDLCEWGAARGALWGAAIGWVAGGVIGAHWKMELPGLPQRHFTISAMPFGGRGGTVALRVE